VGYRARLAADTHTQKIRLKLSGESERGVVAAADVEGLNDVMLNVAAEVFDVVAY
jgi:hypothetical protein